MKFTSAKVPTSPQFQDLTGKTFHRLTVARFAGMVGIKAYWHCQCACGGKATVAGNHLKTGNVKSCGCLLTARSKDLAGRRFYRWLVLQRSQEKKQYWLCRCDCGTEMNVHGSSLIRGLSHSCGCWRSEVSAQNIRTLQNRMRAERRRSKTKHRDPLAPKPSIATGSAEM